MNKRNDPFDARNSMFDQLRRAMLLGDSRSGWTDGPNLRTELTEDAYVVNADLAGFEKADIAVRYEDGLLSITAERSTADETDLGISSGRRRVQEELQVPVAVVEEEIAATYQNGVLEITLPTEADVADDEHVIDIQ
jgi:HSP20 family protein